MPLAEKEVYRLDLVAWTTDGEFNALFDQLWLLSKTAFEVSDGPGAWLRAQKLDAALRDALTAANSPEIKYLKNRLAQLGLVASAEDVAAWFKSRLLEPPPLPAAPIEQPYPLDKQPAHAAAGETSSSANYWMVPASDTPKVDAATSLRQWLLKDMWGFWESTPGRKALKVGDWIAFYAVGKGVHAYARVAGPTDTLVSPAEWPETSAQTKPVYKIPLKSVSWLDHPRPITLALRASLDAFQDHDPAGNWSWLVQTTRRVSAKDFARLTGAETLG